MLITRLALAQARAVHACIYVWKIINNTALVRDARSWKPGRVNGAGNMIKNCTIRYIRRGSAGRRRDNNTGKKLERRTFPGRGIHVRHGPRAPRERDGHTRSSYYTSRHNLTRVLAPWRISTRRAYPLVSGRAINAGGCHTVSAVRHTVI